MVLLKYMSGKQKLRLLIPFLSIFLFSCESEYTKVTKAELDKGVRYDSLFFGINLGQPKQEFFEICWDLHKQGVLTNSTRDNYVQYNLNKDFPKIQMHFYPEADAENIISEMDIIFDYSGWSPWNEKYSSDSLMPVIIDTLEAWYPGNKFFDVQLENEVDISVKIDGNRRIAVRRKDDRFVQAKITDLTSEINE